MFIKIYGIILFINILIIRIESSDQWENIHIICPSQCVCQYSHFMDVSVARWITGLKTDKNYREYEETDENDVNGNQVFYENDTSYQNNPLMRFVMCMLQTNGNPKDLISSLPQDAQILVLLYNSDNSNITISTSDLLTLNDLITLEIRGTIQHTLKLILDEPLPNLQYVNLEAVELLGSENSRRNPKNIHPSENYDYVPSSEKFTYNISIEITDEIEIVPYDVYLMEKQYSKIPSFYEWKQLSVLRIHNSKFPELHWEMFDELNNLHHLSLEHNDIKIIPPFAFYGAQHIKTLSVAHNSILDLNYRALAGLLELESLDLSYNNLSKLSELTFPPFPNLISIDFTNNPIKYIFPMTFGVMNNTRKLLIGSDVAALDLSIGNSFAALDELKYLLILNATTDTLNQNVFKGLKNIEIIRIKGKINKIEFDSFAEMPNLKELTLSNCGINEVSMDAFYGIRNLEFVDLSSNNLTSLPPGLFDEQKKLKEIYLQNNRLSELPKNFFNNTVFKLVRLINNPWICTCEMNTWKQSVTNKERQKEKPSEKCMYNLKTGAKEMCSKIDNYVFDNKLSPRCDGGPKNVQYRSVYYTLRKTLKCKSYIEPVIKKVYSPEKIALANKYFRLMEQKHIREKSLRESQLQLTNDLHSRFRNMKPFRKSYETNENNNLENTL